MGQKRNYLMIGFTSHWSFDFRLGLLSKHFTPRLKKKNDKKQSHRNQDAWTCALLDTKSLERGAASINKPDQLQSGTLTVSVFCQSYDLNSATQHHPAQNDPWTESGIINLVKLVQSKLIGGGWSQFVIHAEMFTEAYKMESIYTILGVNIKKTSHYGTQVSVK